MKILKQVVDEFSKWTWAPVTLLLLLNSWKEKIQIIENATASGQSINGWDVFVTLISDPYVIIYLIFPIWLFFTSKRLMDSWDYALLLRVKSYRGWVFYTIRHTVVFSVVMLFIWCLASLAVSVDLPFGEGWSQYSSGDLGFNHISFTYQTYVSHPLFAALEQLCLFFAFLVTIHVLLASLISWRPTYAAVTAASFILYVGSIVSFKLFPIGWGQITTYMFAHASLSYYHSVVPSFAVLLAFNSIGFLLIKRNK